MRTFRRALAALPLLVLLFWRPTESTWSAMWTERWGLVACGAAVYAITRLRVSWVYRTFLMYFCVLGSVCVFSRGLYAGIQPEVVLMLRRSAGEEMIAGACFLAFLFSRLDLERGIRISAWIMFAAIALSPHPGTEVLLMHNPSIAATFVVLGTWCSPLSIISVVLAKSWTAAGTLAVALLYRYRAVLFPWGIFVAFVSIAVTPFAPFVIPDNGRFHAWGELFTWWWSQPARTILLGAGPGSVSVTLPMLNLAHATGDTAHVFIWAHNDWLTWLVECGCVGACLSIACAWRVLRDARERDRAVVLAFYAAMGANFVCHLALPALLGWCLVKRSVKKVKVEDDSPSGKSA